jgi:hypothetical protein
VRARRAEAEDQDLGTAGAKARRRSPVQQVTGLKLAIEILDAGAAAAHHVLVGLDTCVIQRGAEPRVDPPRESQLHQQVKGGVDRGGGGPRELIADRVMYLLSGCMPAAAAQVAQDHESLGGDALASAAKQLDQVALLDRGRGSVGRAGACTLVPLRQTDR